MYTQPIIRLALQKELNKIQHTLKKKKDWNCQIFNPTDNNWCWSYQNGLRCNPDLKITFNACTNQSCQKCKHRPKIVTIYNQETINP